MKIAYTRSAEKELLALEKPLAQQIFKKLASLQANPFPPNSKKLKGHEEYRFRIGDY